MLTFSAKQHGCRAFIKANKLNATYKFITEEDIFETYQDYIDLLEKI